MVAVCPGTCFSLLLLSPQWSILPWRHMQCPWAFDWDIYMCYPSFSQFPVFWSWRFYGLSGLLSPTGWNRGACDVWWVLVRKKWDSLGRPGVLGVQFMSRHISMREEEEVTLSRYIGILGRKVGFIYLYSETSKWKLPSWPTVTATERPPCHLG